MLKLFAKAPTTKKKSSFSTYKGYVFKFNAALKIANKLKYEASWVFFIVCVCLSRNGDAGGVGGGGGHRLDRRVRHVESQRMGTRCVCVGGGYTERERGRAFRLL